MRDHRFPIGLSVRLKNRTYIAPEAAETYRITAKLPLTSSWPQYCSATTKMRRALPRRNCSRIFNRCLT
ncbi:hypothetical protein GOD58_24615 [Sinorhizobium medicae]|nr:hypothetical protein [Sinorhizobium medicae]